MNGVIVSKRPLSKQVIIKNDKFKKSTFQFTPKINSVQSMDTIESDCAIKIKDIDYTPQMLCVNHAMEATSNNFDKIQIGKKSINFDEISVTELDSKLRSKNTICLIDTRDVRTFKNGHIIGSELFNCTTRIMMMKAKKNWDKFSQQRFDFETIVLYNQRGEKNAHLIDFVEYLKKDFESVYFVTGGYEEYINYFPKGFIKSTIPEEKIDQYHYSPTNESNRSTDVLNATISEILPFLFLGNEMDSNDVEVLQEKKITHILNVTTNVPFYREDLFIYKRLSATDCNKQDMRAYYDEAIQFIDEAYSQNGKVLVHCWAGVSRSATIVAAYLLKHTKLSVLQTIMFLQSKRPIVEPNFNFLGQLERYYCDLELGVESRSKEFSFGQVEQIARKLASEHEKMKEMKLSSNSSSSSSPNTPPPKPYFNFIK